MDTTRFLAAAATTAAAGVAGLIGAAIASADDGGPSVQPLGQQGQLVDGGNVQGWTVGNLQPSPDAIAYQPGGALWEATATDQAIAGGAIPFVPNFSARAANGDDYRALFQVPTAAGINPSGLAQGQSATGKLYFDVTGENPNSVVFGDAGNDQLIWVEPPPSAEGDTTGYSGSARPATGYGALATPAQTGTGASATVPATTPAATGQAATSTPAGTAAAAAAADDVHGAATAAQPKPTAAPLDVHDTTVAPTAAPQGAAVAPAPAAAPATAAPAAAAPTAAPATAVPAAAPAAPTTAAPATAAAAPKS